MEESAVNALHHSGWREEREDTSWISVSRKDAFVLLYVFLRMGQYEHS